MNSKNRVKLQKAVKVLKDLHFNEENIMVTGSIALDAQGLLTNRIAHDIDFIIKMDEQTWRCMKLIEAINLVDDENEKFKDYDSPAKKNTIFLKVDGMVLNIWRYDKGFDWSEIKDADTGVYIATVNNIIEAKKKYGRDKDIVDIYNITKSIL